MTRRTTGKPVLTTVPDTAELPDPDSQPDDDADDGVVEIVRDDEAQNARDAALGMSVVGYQNKPTATRRAARNARERWVRAQDKAAGIRRRYKNVSPLRKFLAVAANPDTYELADAFPAPPAGPGRKARHPAWVMVVAGAGYEACGSIMGSLTLLQEPVVWNAVLDEVEQAADPDDPETDSRLAETALARRLGPPDLNAWNYFTRTWACDPDTQHRVHRTFRLQAAAQAAEQGRFDSSVPMTPNKVDTDRYAYADGVVIGSPSRALTPTTQDPDTGEILIRRYDTAKGLHWQGGNNTVKGNGVSGGNLASGSKFNILWNRGTAYGTRLVLDVRPQPADHPGGEGAMLVEMFRDLVAAAPGVHGLLTDGILRGAHLREIFTSLGRIVISPVAAKRRSKNDPNDFTIRFNILPLVKHRPDGNDCKHELHAGYGSVWARHKQNRAAKPTLVRLDTVQRYSRPNADGTTRWYLVVRIPCNRSDEGHHDHTIGLAHGEKNEPDFNRLEYLRLFAPADDVYAAAYPRRVDAEAGNRDQKRPFQDDRIPAYGHDRQWLVMLLKGHAMNSTSRWLHRNPQVLRDGPGAGAAHGDGLAA